MKTIYQIILFFLALSISCPLVGQKSQYVWAFGDSAGINFNNLTNPQPIASNLDSRGSCVSISDTNGILLFYSGISINTIGFSASIYNGNNQLVANGDSIVGEGWYNELLILPMPNFYKKFYVFSIDVSSYYGFYYSIVDMNLNGGLGEVTIKNQTLHNIQMADCLGAIKHANGRDWWLLMRTAANNFDDKYYRYLVSPNGID
ncbi:MAG TPA: hypothetical protein PLG57_11230, partial [Bacteroidia bacterium]|nr:hypothetical protein [Bacteroidia bacterium]